MESTTAGENEAIEARTALRLESGRNQKGLRGGEITSGESAGGDVLWYGDQKRGGLVCAGAGHRFSASQVPSAGEERDCFRVLRVLVSHLHLINKDRALRVHRSNGFRLLSSV